MRKIVLLIILVIFVSILFFYRKTRIGINEVLCEEFQTNYLKNLCKNIFAEKIEECEDNPDFSMICYEILIKKINQKLNTEFCSSLLNSYARNVCFLELAIKNLDLKLCSYTTRPKCTFEIAMRKKDVEICNEIDEENLKYTCLSILGRDKTYCNKIQDSFERDNCEAIFSKDITICKENDECLLNMALSNSDSNICNLIKSELMRATCMMKVLKNIEACNNAIVSYVRDLCRLEFIKMKFHE